MSFSFGECEENKENQYLGGLYHWLLSQPNWDEAGSANEKKRLDRLDGWKSKGMNVSFLMAWEKTLNKDMQIYALNNCTL